MPATLVQSHIFYGTGGGPGGGTGGSIGTVTAGNTLVIIVSSRCTVVTAPIVISSILSENSLWTAVPTQAQDDATTFNNISIFHASIVSSGADIISCMEDNDTDATVTMVVLEFSGVKTSSPKHAAASAIGVTGNPITGSVTTTAKELLVGACTYIGTSVVASSGFTEVYNDATAPRTQVEYRTDPSGSQTVGWTGTVLTDWIAVAVSFKIQVPTAPSVLAGTAVGSTEIDLTWTDNSNNEDNFSLDRADAGTSFLTNLVTTTPAANAISASVTGLSASTSYDFRIKAVNAGGSSSYSSTLTKSTNAPSVPSNRLGLSIGIGL